MSGLDYTALHILPALSVLRHTHTHTQCVKVQLVIRDDTRADVFQLCSGWNKLFRGKRGLVGNDGESRKRSLRRS